MWATKNLNLSDTLRIYNDVNDYRCMDGLLLRRSDQSNNECIEGLPVTLFPTPMPKSLYYRCLDNQPTFHKLYHSIANDFQFMQESLSNLIKVDQFTNDLFNIYQQTLREGLAQPIGSCIFRSDYMIDKAKDIIFDSIKQVEINTIASSMSKHSVSVSKLHNYITTKYHLFRNIETEAVVNNSLDIVSCGLINAYDVYRNSDSAILFVMEDYITNFCDSFGVELRLHELRPDIKVLRERFIDLHSKLTTGPNKELFVEKHEISVVYYRYCYDPRHYNSSKAWSLRLEIEKSKAIKCPSINYHLSGMKIFQQKLNTAMELERFLDHKEAQKLAKFFCKIWPLDSQDGYNMAKNSKDQVIVKPQREGGGHNIYDEMIPPFLESLKDDSLLKSQYIVMKHISSPTEKNWLLKRGNNSKNLIDLSQPEQLISELGIYGSVVSNKCILKEDSGGYLVRSKNVGVIEGGVAAGYAGISSLFLVDQLKENFPISHYYFE